MRNSNGDKIGQQTVDEMVEMLTDGVPDKHNENIKLDDEMTNFLEEVKKKAVLKPAS